MMDRQGSDGMREVVAWDGVHWYDGQTRIRQGSDGMREVVAWDGMHWHDRETDKDQTRIRWDERGCSLGWDALA